MSLDESRAVRSNVAESMKEEVPVVNNNDDASSSPGRSSPDANCPICLGKLENKSFTDSCLHQFCFKCLLEWSKVKAECPLCKQSFKSIIHNVRSIEDYEQYYLSTTSTEGTLFVSREIFARLESPDVNRVPPNVRFRTTAVSSYLDYFVRLEEAISHRVLPPGPSGPSISSGPIWQRRRQRGTSDFRRNIYQLGMWVQRTSDVTGRVRECSPEFYRSNPAQVHRLVPWLNRELNVLLYENSPHIQHVMSRILELITQVPIRSPGFAAVMAPYIGRNTEHFIHEFHSFAISPFDIIGYDRHANYVGRSQISDYHSSHDSDSDVQVLEEGVHAPSPLIQLVDTDSDDCIVLDTPVRPQPDVITLDSDGDDVVQINIETHQPSQSTSGQTSTASTSQQRPSTSRRPRLKRNWLTVNNIQVPSTSTSDIKGCEISISIAHSSRSLSPTVSEDSSSSYSPVRRRPSKPKKKAPKKKSRKGKPVEVPTCLRVVSESEPESLPRPVTRRKEVPTLKVESESEPESLPRPVTRRKEVPALRAVSESEPKSSYGPMTRRKEVPTLKVESESEPESLPRPVTRRKEVSTLKVVSESEPESSPGPVTRRKEVPTLRVISESEPESSPGPVTRRKPSVAIVSTSSENGSERTSKEDVKQASFKRRERKQLHSPISSDSLQQASFKRRERKQLHSPISSDSLQQASFKRRERKQLHSPISSDSLQQASFKRRERKQLHSPISSDSVKQASFKRRERKQLHSPISSDSDDDRLYMDTDTDLSSDVEYKPRLKSVVVKSIVKPEPRTVSPDFAPPYGSEIRDYESLSSHFTDLPSCSRSRSNSYRSIHSHRSRHSSTSSPERYKRCKYSKKRSK